MLAAATIVVDAAMLLLHLCNMCKTEKAHGDSYIELVQCQMRHDCWAC